MIMQSQNIMVTLFDIELQILFLSTPFIIPANFINRYYSLPQVFLKQINITASRFTLNQIFNHYINKLLFSLTLT